MSDALVLGAGVDELVAAHYLARAGHRVRVLSRSGEAVSDAHVGWVPPHVVRDLGLDRKGMVVSTPDVWAVVPLPAGGMLELTSDVVRCAEAIRKASARDAGRWPEFCRRMHALAAVLGDIYSAPPPDPLAGDIEGLTGLARSALRARKLGREGIEDLLRVLPMSVADLLDDWFESDALKGALGAAGVLHLCQGPRSGGTAFNFLHHHVGSAPGVFRPPLSNIQQVLSDSAAFEKREAEVTRITIRDGCVQGVVLASGEEIAASLVVSGAPPKRVLLELSEPGWLDPELVRAIRNIRSRGVVARVELSVDGGPGFGTLVVAPSLDQLERAYDDAKYGRVSRQPYVEARHEALADGAHRVNALVQYVPYALSEAAPADEQRSGIATLAIGAIENALPGFARSVTGHTVMTPRDLEVSDGSPQGQAYHAEMALDQTLWMRPVPALAHYRTPIRGLYLCGPSMHPGGAITGAAGANAASVILGDLKKSTKL